jgi:glucosylceramidase
MEENKKSVERKSQKDIFDEIKRMKKITLVAFAIFIGSCSQKKSPSTANDVKPFSTEGKSVAVYTTADSSNFRLSLTDNVQFRELKQPLETTLHDNF